MASKSKYLNELIDNTLKPSTNIIDAMWEKTPNKNSIISEYAFDSISTNSNTLIYDDAWLNGLDIFETNTNHTVNDTSTTYKVQQITKDLTALPVTHNFNNLKASSYRFNGSLPGIAGKYTICTLTPYKGTTKGTPIDVLFAKDFSRSLSASFSKQNPIGSSNAIMAYAYTDSENIQLTFDCLSEYLPTAYQNSGLATYVEDILGVLKPTISNNVIKEPRVNLSFAGLSMNCICNSATVNYDNLYDNLSDTKKRYFAHATINVSLTRLDTDSPIK